MFVLPSKRTSGGNSLTAAVLLVVVHFISLLFHLLVLSIITLKVFSVLTLSCPSNNYQAGNTCCPKCPAGNKVRTDCTEGVNTSCVSCGSGTYMDRPSGLKQCNHCTHCDPASGLREKRSCTITSDAVCEPLEGFFCLDHAGGSCWAAHKHKRCEPGQYVSKTGTHSTDTECSECHNGTFSDGTLKMCQPHRQCESLNLQLITPGNATSDAQCEEQHDDVTRHWIIAGCLVLILLIVIVIICFKHKIPRLKQNRDGTL